MTAMLQPLKVSNLEIADAIERGADYIAAHGWRVGAADSWLSDMKEPAPLCMQQAILYASPFHDFPTAAVKAQNMMNDVCHKQFSMDGADWNDRLARGQQNVVEFMRKVATDIRNKNA